MAGGDSRDVFSFMESLEDKPNMAERHDCESSSPRIDDPEECAKVLIGEWHRVSLEMVCVPGFSPLLYR